MAPQPIQTSPDPDDDESVDEEQAVAAMRHLLGPRDTGGWEIVLGALPPESP